MLLPSVFSSIASLVWLAAFFDSDEGGMLFLLLLLAGPIFFGIFYLRYRNSDKRHFHESETPVQIANLHSFDQFVSQLKNQRSNTIAGANNAMVHGSILGDNLKSGYTGTSNPGDTPTLENILRASRPPQ